MLQNDSYVDDILTSHNNRDQLNTITTNVERILKAGGFELKPWVLSGQSGRKACRDEQEELQVKTMVLPNQMNSDDNKALGLGYIVEEDEDMTLSDYLREDAMQLFEEYVQLSKVSFPRALTPPCHRSKPLAITFSDGSEQGPVIRLVESKAKQTPLDHKGDAVKAEMCGPVVASRLKKYFELHSWIQVERSYHLVDSQTVGKKNAQSRRTLDSEKLAATWIL